MLVQDKNFQLTEIIDELFISQNNLKNKFVIALDFDGVICNPHVLKTKYLNELGYKVEECNSMRGPCVKKLNIPEDEYVRASRKASLTDPKNLPLKEGFIEEFQKLKQLPNSIILIVSGRYDDMINHLQKYLDYYDIKVDGIINTNLKSKFEGLKNNFVDVFVDDDPLKVNNIFKSYSEKESFFTKCRFILYRMEANKNQKNPHEIILEASDWNQIYELIEEKYKERQK